MTASIALNNALSGLNINQQQLTVLSQNIANANTAGYSKQTLNQEAVALNGVDEGVNVESITRTIDQYLTAATENQNSTVGQTSTLNDYYTKIQLLLGQPGNSNSLDTYVNNFFNAAQALGQTPDNSTLQQSVVNDGVQLATQYNQLASGLNNLQFQADQGISSAVQTINTDLKNIFKLNQTIQQQASQGQSVANLQDQRDQLITDISQYMNVSTIQTTSGALFLTTNDGINLLNDTQYQLQYTPAAGAASFGNNTPLSALTISPIDSNGNPTGTPISLITAGTPLASTAANTSASAQPTTLLTSGKIAAYESLRDQVIPNILAQLDSSAATLRDKVNAITNSGSGYPGAASLTGNSLVNAAQTNQWTGTVTIGVVNSNGQPISSPYNDETYGMQPLTLNLGALNTGSGAGNLSVQGIINVINQYYGVPQNKAEVGNLNNIQLISNSPALPDAGQSLNFGFNLNNISGTSSSFYMTNVSVTANNANGSTQSIPASSTVPTINLNPANTYVTSAGNTAVTINTTGGNNNLTNGETVFLSTPPAGPDAGGTYGGIAPASLGGYFTVSNVTANSFQIQANTNATMSVSDSVAGQTAKSPYASVPTGSTVNTSGSGTVTADLSGDPNANSYTITATVGVNSGSGNIKTSQITYQVFNNQNALTNKTYGATTATGQGTIVAPTSFQPAVVARLVDASGNELPKVNGQYITTQNGYLELATVTGSTFLAINSGNSQELGLTSTTPPAAATNKGFSNYFNLNDFFQTGSNNQTSAVQGSALTLAVQQRLQNNNSLLSVGQLTQGTNSVATGVPPNYTYQLNPGNGTVAQQLASLGQQAISFSATGGLGATSQTISGYTGVIIGNIATNAATATTNSNNAQSLLQGYQKQASSVSGVNLDTELANTVIYQNAYAASARIITVTNTFFDSLLQAFTG